MRISTATIYEKGLNGIQEQQAALINTQQQISSGRRMLSPSDDPIAAAQAINITQTLSLNNQFSINRDNTASTLGLVDNVLEGITSNVQDIRRLAVNAGNPTLSDTDRNSLATELRGRLNALVGMANSTDGTGQFLFSGFQGSTKPFTQTGLNVQYLGDQGQRLSQVSATRQMPVSDSGSNVFERIKDGNGVFTTAANPTNNGTAISDIGSVINPALLTGNEYEIQFTVTPTPTPPFSVTTYDIFNVTTAAIVPPAANPYTEGANISFDGMQFTIVGEPENGDIFTVKPSTNESIFETVGNLITALETIGGGQPGGTRMTNIVNTTLTNLDNSIERILQTRATVGSNLQEIDVLDSVGGDLAIQFEKRLSQLQDVDMAKALTDLNRQQVFLEASQRSFVTVSGLSLFNFL